MIGALISALRPFLAGFTAFVTAITLIICPTPADTDTASVESERCYSVVDAFVMGQGLDEEGDYYYTSGSLAGIQLCCLGIVDKATGEIVKDALDSLPQEFKDKDYDHIGDISVQNGIIYAPVEDKTETQPLVLLYDAATLEYTGIYYELDATNLTDGIPWCATDGNYLYASQFNDADKIVVFNIDDMTLSHTVELSTPVERVQSGDVYDGVLYLSCDPHDENKTVYSVDLGTGEVTLLCDRATTGYDTEAEGLCVNADEDGNTIVHVSDYNKLISTFIRTYKVK